MKSGENVDHTDKIKIDLIVVGNSNTGKTSLIKRYVKGEESFMNSYQPSIGMSLEKKTVEFDGQTVSVHIWDTAGQQKFFAIAKNYFRKADGVLIIFDITDKHSFDRINNYWINEIKDHAPKDSAKIVIGNKLDLSNQRNVSIESGKEMAEQFGYKYFETSAKTGENIEEALNSIIKQCTNKISTSQGGIDIEVVKQPKKTGCFGGLKQSFLNIFEKEGSESK